MSISVSWITIVIAALAAMVVGWLWYGPLFGKKWLAYMGWTRESMAERKPGMGGKWLLGLVGALVMTVVLAHFVTQIGITRGDLTPALKLAVWVWLGFFATRALSGVIWEGKPFGLYVLNVLHDLVVLAVVSAILVLWR